ncbi:MAG: hypothetical protein UY23_C0002G0047 [Candidatus Jorgensenbacteria bacterium GW2011_GWA1_48_11]|uniref:UDP-N-acetylglucosamine--N-acetylmuramyl-(pentapeptide) pyrophosphoryl-undecaprenol N-acetylglucosamine transferase n=1 Tax=Candidatus Jorgensenbacteria bacterium GW2011_GWA1_48_11 TaxID=1618660 RepID=A0A0G1WLU6_9BACT|nr:MAG: hypothetical protein UY23_C0002G0047 [Candidatus Jorgensenbacteria bacterium GW2011_GWA1_48_11]KKW12746.1 MAG: hypothetical protein UY51_C0001G0046 [Candidatus Jorgensenbacteria bacterium GW2011_GWB1_49_9]
MVESVRILLTGGGSGGHVYPLVAVAEELKKQAPQAQIYYFGPKSALNAEFVNLGIGVYNIASSKLRRYFSLANFIDVPKFFWSLVQAFFKLYFLMPDVVFSKGGPGALSVILAAKFYLIPVIIHESDAVPGLTNRLSAKLAKRIGISFAEAAKYFPKNKTALVGNPLRSGLLASVNLTQAQAKKDLRFETNKPLILVLGGSQGAQVINSLIWDNFLSILEISQVYHQVGDLNLSEIKDFIAGAPQEIRLAGDQYKFTGFFDLPSLREALFAADLVISRAGAGAIFEIAAFGKPSILVPLEGAANGHQRVNAYAYAETGAAEVIEEENFTINILKTQIKDILGNAAKMGEMATAAKAFAKPDTAQVLAKEILFLSGARFI